MGRVQFKKKGEQRRFIDTIIQETGAVNLKGIQELGITTPYSTLKNYYTEQRLLPKELYEDMCDLADIDRGMFEHTIIEDSWGQTKGGRKSKRKARRNPNSRSQKTSRAPTHKSNETIQIKMEINQAI